MSSLGIITTNLQSPTTGGVVGSGGGRPTSSYSGFQLPSSSSGGGSSPTSSAAAQSDSDPDEGLLPFPSALARNDFLAADFQPAAYLSSLFPSDADTTSAHRHQTLEDLRAELRERSSAISAELLELVNANYTSFLELGDELRGGEDKVEDVRVALMGFRRVVDDMQGRVRRRRLEVHDVCRDLAAVRADVELGRRLLDLDERLSLLEGRLVVGSLPKTAAADADGFGIDESDEDDDDDDDEEEEEGGVEGGEGGAVSVVYVGSSPGKLRTLAIEYVVAERLADSIGRDVPLVRKMDERMKKCRNTIVLDLNTAIKEARRAGKSGQSRVMRLLAIYPLVRAEAEAVRVLRER